MTAIGSSFGLASTTGGSVNAIGFGTRTGVSTDSGNSNAASVSTGNLFNIWWDNPNAYFFIDNTRVGYFQFGTSDYRIKRNLENLDINGIERLKKLRPIRFNWKVAPEKTQDGFFAHEVSEAVPEAVTGEKDGTEIQQLDNSKLVPLLVAAVQELITKVEILEAA